ncbi:hypothetical protein AbraIFM66951_009151, partial [Aspergillus brasiliensis]
SKHRRQSTSITFSRRAYLDTVLEPYGFSDAKPVPTPFNEKQVLFLTRGPLNAPSSSILAAPSPPQFLGSSSFAEKSARSE